MSFIPPLKSGSIQKGKGHFTYNQYAPLADKPLTIFYYAPQRDLSTLKIVIVLSGVLRNADEYRDYWVDLADQYKLLIIAPMFSHEFYPDSRSYNLGNVLDDHAQVLPEDKWSYSIIDPLFDDVKQMINGKQSAYFLFGHSAGAQFVHRLMIFKPSNKIHTAIVANAGWYTLPDFEVTFPYGLNQSPAQSTAIPAVFKQKLVLMLGENDNDPNSLNLRHTPEADLQGESRLTRGYYFFEHAKNIAHKRGLAFKWTLATVPDTEHEAAKMSVAAARWLFD